MNQSSENKESQTKISSKESTESERTEFPVKAAITSLVLIAAGLGHALGGTPVMLLVVAGSSLTLAIGLIWRSLQRMGEADEMDFEEALSLAAPSATEEQKRAVLRALKDLEYERHVGKISEEDFKLVSAEYRKKAKELIAAQDEKMAAQLAAAEKRVNEHLTSNEEKASQ